MSRRKQAYPKPLKEEGAEVPEDCRQPAQTYLREASDKGLPDESDDAFCPLVIDTSDDANASDSNNKTATHERLTSGLQTSLTSDLQTTSTPPGHMIPDSALVTMETTKSRLSSVSSSDCNDVIDDVANGYGNQGNRGKGTAPSKTRRKGDRILPVETSAGDKFMCPVCRQILDSAPELTRHIRSHNTATAATSVNACTICGKILSSQSSLDRHMLVHSGERPFECRVCKMSFTTNGNMHRHMRIHEKEIGSLAPPAVAYAAFPGPPPQYKDLLPRTRTYKPRRSVHSSLLLQNKPESLQTKPESLQTKPESLQNKLQSLQNKPESPILLPAKRKPDPEPDTPRKKLVPQIGIMGVPQQGRPPAGINVQPTEDVGEKVAIREKMELKPDLPPPPVHPRCPVCGDRFFCRYGLDAHLRLSHADVVDNVCRDCFMVFHSPRGLQVHQMMVHRSPHKLPLPAPPPGTPAAPTSPGPPSEGRVGFHDLDFVDFSAAKFCDIARVACERSPRAPASHLHDFSCGRCGRAFPSRGALRLHGDARCPERTTRCVPCDVTLRTEDEHRQHSHQHCQQQVLEGYVQLCGADDNDLQDCVSQPEFLLLLGLQARVPDNEASPRQPQVTSDRQDLKLNVEYFSKVLNGKPASPAIPPRDSSRPSPLVAPSRGAVLRQQLEAPVDNQAVLGWARGVGSPIPPGTDSLHALSLLATSQPDTGRGGDEDDSSQSVPESPERDDGTAHLCKYCDDGFPSYKAMKIHERCHLGLSPYQCNLCSYSSTDKSTLVRHLRTHNGERPYQCLVCEFAFTTKANCERHIRKRHNLDTREEIDSVIGYSQPPPSDVSRSSIAGSGPEQDSFASPDTVCQFCGEDFRFFRALKHHLRTHSNCRDKPFVCSLCTTGFSTKANCVRHVVNKHPEIEPQLLEGHILVKELPDHEQKSPVLSSTPHGQPPSRGFRAPADSPIASIWQPSKTASYITTPPNSFMKTELRSINMDSGFEQPLDFSMKTKTKKEPESALDMSTPSFSSLDTPMDLTVKRADTKANHPSNSRDVKLHPCYPRPFMGFSPKPKTSEINSSVLNVPRPSPNNSAFPAAMFHQLQAQQKKDFQRFFNPALGQLQCPLCNMVFKHSMKLLLHMRSHANDANFSAKANMMRHHNASNMEPLSGIQKRSFLGQLPPMMPGPLRTSPSPQQRPRYKEPNNNIVPKPEPFVPRSPLNSSFSSDSELASVNRILDNTDPAKFQRFFRERNSPPSGSLPPRQSLLQNSGDRALIGMTTLANQGSFGYKPSIKGELDDQRSSTPVSAASQPTATSSRGSAPSPALLGDDSSDDSRAHSPGSEAATRKRNSYADSPNRLQCPYCPRAFPWISSLKRHILTHTGQKPFKCPSCPVTFSTKSNRERHMIRKHGLNVHDLAARHLMDRPYKCHLCVCSSFSCADNLLKHFKERHPERDSGHGASVGSTCGSEDAASSYNDGATDDLSLGGDMGDYEDEEEDDDFPMSLEPEIPAHRRQQLFSGDHRDVSRPSSELPLRAVSPALLAPSPTLLAPSPTLPLPRGLQHDSDRQVNPERDNYNVDKITDCWKCNIRFDSRKSLLRHLKEHSIDLPFKCYLCDASYDTRAESLAHKQHRHLADWEVIRDKNKIGDAGSFVSAQDALVEETLAGRLPARGAGHDDDMKPECDYAQRKVYCSLCIKRFWSLQDLRRHMRSHTGERPFECDICQARFTLKHSMMRHRRKHCEGEGVTGASDDETSAGFTDHGDLFYSNLRPASVSPKLSRHSNVHRASVNSAAEGLLQNLHRDRSSNSAPSDILQNIQRGSNSVQGDLLQNLLGVADSAIIDQMLDSVDNAVEMLGVRGAKP